MAARLVWTESALADLEALAMYIGEDSPHYAALTVERIVAAAERVSEFPRSGHVVPEFGEETIREVIWRQYRIVYKVTADVVTVLTVVHGARELGAGPDAS
jgi:toxin ParE1/3/4